MFIPDISLSDKNRSGFSMVENKQYEFEQNANEQIRNLIVVFTFFKTIETLIENFSLLYS